MMKEKLQVHIPESSAHPSVRLYVRPLELFRSPTRDLEPAWLHANRSWKDRRPFLWEVGNARAKAGKTQHEPGPAWVATREEVLQWGHRGTQEILSRHS